MVESNRVKIRKVITPAQSQGIALVESGLSQGETILLYAGESLEEGTKVKPQFKH